MKTAPLADVKAHLSALVDEVARTHEQVTITRNGEPVAYGVRYRIHEDANLVVVLDIAGRADVYHTGRA
jgi:antitoxin YefM